MRKYNLLRARNILVTLFCSQIILSASVLNATDIINNGASNSTEAIAVIDMHLSANVLSISIEDTIPFKAIIEPTTANNKSVTWASSNQSIATVSTTGLVTGISIGDVIITATTDDGGFFDNCKIKVTKKDVFRFLVSGDTHINTHSSNGEDGWHNDRDLWYSIPNVMLETGSEYFLVVGDLMDNMHNAWSDFDSAYAKSNWDIWDEYETRFEGIGKIEWCEGYHEAAGDPEAHEYFFNHYADHLNYVVEEGDNVIISFDMQFKALWEELNPGKNGLDWLEAQFIKYSGKHIFMMQHVPLAHSPNLFSPLINHYDSLKFGHDISLNKFNFDETRRFGQLLNDYQIEAVFYGHLHSYVYYGNHCGVKMFEVYQNPLMVEVIDGEVNYIWLTDTFKDDILSSTRNVFDNHAERSWHVAVIPPGDDIAEAMVDIDPNKALTLSSGSTVDFTFVKKLTDKIDLSSFAGVEKGAKIVAIGPTSSEYKHSDPLIRSTMPYTFYANGIHIETSGATNGNYHKMGYYASNNFRFIFDVDTTVCDFTIFSNGKPEGPHLPYQNNVATLKSLSLDNGALTTDFYPFTRNYIADAPLGILPVITAETGNTYAEMQITQATNLSGTNDERTATVMVTSKDLTTTYYYTVTFEKQAIVVNKAPTINTIEDQTQRAKLSPYQINLTGITDGDNGLQTIDISASSSNASVLSNISINYSSPESAAVLNYKVSNGDSSSATINISLKDNGTTTNGGENIKQISFIVNVDDYVSISDKSLNKIKLYPNPAKNTLNVSLAKGSPSQIRITSVIGETIKIVNVNSQSNSTDIDISSLKPGVYLLFVTDGEDVYKSKFIVE